MTTEPRKPDYDKFVAGLDALRELAEGMAQATAVRDVWRFAYHDDPEALDRRLEGLDQKTLIDLLVGARRLATAVKRRHAGLAEE